MSRHSVARRRTSSLATVGVERVRALIAEAGLSRTQITASTRRLFSGRRGGGRRPRLGRPEADGDRLAAEALRARPSEQPETMVSTADEMVRWYLQALREGMLPEARDAHRVQADSSPWRTPSRWWCRRIRPPMLKAAASTGRISMLQPAGPDDLHGIPVPFCFTIRRAGPRRQRRADVRAPSERVADVLRQAAAAV